MKIIFQYLSEKVAEVRSNAVPAYGSSVLFRVEQESKVGAVGDLVKFTMPDGPNEHESLIYDLASNPPEVTIQMSSGIWRTVK